MSTPNYNERRNYSAHLLKFAVPDALSEYTLNDTLQFGIYFPLTVSLLLGPCINVTVNSFGYVRTYAINIPGCI